MGSLYKVNFLEENKNNEMVEKEVYLTLVMWDEGKTKEVIEKYLQSKKKFVFVGSEFLPISKKTKLISYEYIGECGVLSDLENDNRYFGF